MWNTFEHDVPLSETEPIIRRLAEKVWSASRNESRIARTVVLKLKTSEFKTLTRSQTPDSPPLFLRRVDGHRAEPSGTSGTRSTATLSAGWDWFEQLSPSNPLLGCEGKEFKWLTLDARHRFVSSTWALEQGRSGLLEGDFPSTFFVIILWTIDPETHRILLHQSAIKGLQTVENRRRVGDAGV